jgi:glycosyltransferase involved in cell wall biosynthesis
MQNKKIAFIIHGLSVGGAERFFISLVNSLFQIGFEPHVILLGDNNPLLGELNKDVKTQIVRRKNKYDLSVGKKVREILEASQVQKIVTINTFPYFLVKLGYLFDRKTRFFLSLHSTKPRSRKEYLQNLAYFRLLNRSDRLLFISKNQRAFLVKKYLLGHAKSDVVYNGIDTNWYSPLSQNDRQPVKSRLKAEYSISGAAKVILSTGRISIEKDHSSAIKALHILRNKMQCDAHLVYVGAGDQKYVDSIQQLIRELGLEKFVHFAGQHKDVRPFFNLADIFTLTSYSETFSLAALEAMSSGLPCSLTDIGGASEMINAETGLLSVSANPESIAESWHALLQKQIDPRILHDYIVANFSLDKMVKAYANVLG